MSPDTVTMKGNPLELEGNPVNVGDAAPEFRAVANDLSVVSPLQKYRGNVLALVAVPSLDTSVCDLESRRFNQEAARLGGQARIVVISTDLPFAQKRWCGAAEATNLETLSDHRDAEFGRQYGVLLKGLRLLARSIFVVDRNGTIAYKQIVPEVTHEPNYDEVLDAIRKLS